MWTVLSQTVNTGLIVGNSLYKDSQREKLRRQTEAYLAAGGNIKQVSPGVSGYHNVLHPAPLGSLSDGPKSTRTPVPEVVAAIEQRRARMTQKSTTRRKPRKKIIYDDFGEPIRWEWDNT